MIKSLLVLVSLLIASVSGANAEENVKQFVDDERYIVVATHFRGDAASLKVLKDVSDALIKAGYRPRDETKNEPVIAARNTWCMVDIKQAIKDRVYCRCYSHSEYPGLIVQDSVPIVGSDYTNVAPTLARLHEMHRRASAVLGIK